MELLDVLYRVLRSAAQHLSKTPVFLFVLAICCAIPVGVMALADQTGPVVVLFMVISGVLALAAIVAWVLAALRGRAGVRQRIEGGSDSSVEADEAQQVTASGPGRIDQTIRGGRRSKVRAERAQQVNPPSQENQEQSEE